MALLAVAPITPFRAFGQLFDPTLAGVAATGEAPASPPPQAMAPRTIDISGEIVPGLASLLPSHDLTDNSTVFRAANP